MMERCEMRELFILLLIFTFAQNSNADLASVFCQDKYADTYDEKMCSHLLIGAIDTIQAYGDYCPDGNTSYGYIVETWQRLLNNKPYLKEVPTADSLKLAIRSELNLACD